MARRVWLPRLAQPGARESWDLGKVERERWIVVDQLEWRDVVGYERFYEVSEDGQVRRKIQRHSKRAGSLLSPNYDRIGYVSYYLVDGYGNRKRAAAHRLVAAAFIGELPEGMEVNHKDLNKQNNRVSNLEYMTHQDNLIHAYASGNCFITRGELNGAAKLTATQVEEIIARKKQNHRLSQRELGAMYGVSSVQIGHILRGTRWAHIKK